MEALPAEEKTKEEKMRDTAREYLENLEKKSIYFSVFQGGYDNKSDENNARRSELFVCKGDTLSEKERELLEIFMLSMCFLEMNTAVEGETSEDGEYPAEAYKVRFNGDVKEVRAFWELKIKQKFFFYYFDHFRTTLSEMNRFVSVLKRRCSVVRDEPKPSDDAILLGISMEQIIDLDDKALMEEDEKDLLQGLLEDDQEDYLDECGYKMDYPAEDEDEDDEDYDPEEEGGGEEEGDDDDDLDEDEEDDEEENTSKQPTALSPKKRKAPES